MASKTIDKKKPSKNSFKKSKNKKKSKLLKYLILFALISIACISIYYFVGNSKKLPKPIRKAVDTIDNLWSKTDNLVKNLQSEKKDIESNITKTKKTMSKEKLELFSAQITPEAKKMIDIPYQMGGDPTKSKATDNSHLIFYIWKNAAERTNQSIGNYRPMRDLILACSEISLSELNNGDLVVLKDGNAGLIYGLGEESDGFNLVYASEKAQKVISVPSKELNLYWLNPKNKKGYYRPSKELFSTTQL